MRPFSIVRALAPAAALSAPLAQAALAQAADQQEQQAMSPNANGFAGSFTDGSPYGNDALTAPAVGD